MIAHSARRLKSFKMTLTALVTRNCQRTESKANQNLKKYQNEYCQKSEL